MHHYSVGPLVSTKYNDISIFCAPAGTTGWIDLGLIDGTRLGFFASTHRFGSEYEPFGSGDLRAIRPSERDRARWAAVMCSDTPKGDLLIDYLRNSLSLLPTRVGLFEIHLGGHGCVWRQPFRPGKGNDSERALLRVRADLTRVRDEAHKGHHRSVSDIEPDYEFHRRVMTATIEQYGVPFEILRPSAWPACETPLPHSTTISDNFNRANQSGVGSSAEGWSWTIVSGDWEIASNNVRLTTQDQNAHHRCRAEFSFASDAHYGEVERVSSPTAGAIKWGPIVRWDPATDSWYGLRLQMNTGMRFLKRVDSSIVVLDPVHFATLTDPNRVRLEADGTTLRRYHNGALIDQITDTSISGYLRTGILASAGGGNTNLDHFVAGNLSGDPVESARRLVNGGFFVSPLIN